MEIRPEEPSGTASAPPVTRLHWAHSQDRARSLSPITIEPESAAGDFGRKGIMNSRGSGRKMLFALSMALVVVSVTSAAVQTEPSFQTTAEPGRVSSKVAACDPKKDYGVYLTVSAEYVADNILGKVVMNWYGFQPQAGDRVVLVRAANAKPDLTDPLKSIVPDNKNRFPTTHDVPRTTFQESSPELKNSTCLGFWIAYTQDGGRKKTAEGCLRTRPDWMWANKKALKDLRLDQIMIPGTRHSGCYTYQDPWIEGKDPAWKAYQKTQNLNVFDQLVFGNRYVHIEVIRKEGKIFVSRGPRCGDRTPEEVLEDVRLFAEKTKEIVLVHFTEFEDLDEDDHHRLQDNIVEILGEHLLEVSRGRGKSMGEIWDGGRRVIVIYGARWMHHAKNVFWDEEDVNVVTTANAVDDVREGIREIRDIIDENIDTCRADGKLCAVQVHLAKRTKDTSATSNSMAQALGRHLDDWYRHCWWSSANIVAADFFPTTDLVEIAITANLRRASCPNYQSPISYNCDD